MKFNLNIKHNTAIFAMLMAFCVIAFIASAHSTDTCIEIGTEKELKAFRDRVNAGEKSLNAKLVDDIHLNPNVNFSPFYEYCGTFDGQGYTIWGGGIRFERLKNATVKNFTLSGRFALCTEAISSKIENCVCNMAVDFDSKYDNMGGICIRANNCIIRNCVVKNNGSYTGIKGKGAVGGICAIITNGTIIENCVNESRVQSTSGPLGGICGEAGNVNSSSATCYIKNCINTGKIVVEEETEAAAVCGRKRTNANVINCGYLKGCIEFGSSETRYTKEYEATELPVTVAFANIPHSIVAGVTVTPDITVYPSNAYNKSDIMIKNDSSDKTIVYAEKYSDQNVIVGIKSGSVTVCSNITGLLGAVEVNCSNKVMVTGSIGTLVTNITLNKSSIVLHPGEVDKIMPTVSPPNCTVPYLEWTSSNISVVTVDSDGNVRAIAPGTATITAKAVDGSGKSAKCQVTVNNDIQLSLNKTETIVRIGTPETLIVTNTASIGEKAVEWSSSNEAVATVDQNGKITAVARGTATITVRSSVLTDRTATCAVTVRNPINVEISQTSATVTGELQLSTTVTECDADDSCEFVWTSSDVSLATVDQTGKVTALSDGVVTITATMKGDPNIKVTSIVTVKCTPEKDKDNYYLIGNKFELAWFCRNVNSGASSLKAKLTADINLEGTAQKQWTPIGNDTSKFKGIFDGQGYTISGLYINDTKKNNQGLFGRLNNATIKNLSVEGSVNAGTYCGGVCGYAAYSTIESCLNRVNVCGAIAGGICGEAYNGTTIFNCVNIGELKYCTNSVGGICGILDYSTVMNSVNEGAITVSQWSELTKIGGVCGYALDADVKNCASTGTITGNDKKKTCTGLLCGVAGASVKKSYINALYGGVNSPYPYIGQKSDNVTASVYGYFWSITYNYVAAIVKTPSKVVAGATVTPIITKYPANCARTPIWRDVIVKNTSSDTTVIYDHDGTMIATAEGKTTITSKVTGLWGEPDVSFANDVEVTGSVAVPVTSITFNKNTLLLHATDSETLIATVSPDNATIKYLEWTSSDPSVATVDSTGKVTAVGNGTCTITAKAIDGSGVTATCAVTVKNAISLTLNKNSTSIRADGTETLIVTNTASPDEQGVTWSSSDSAVATVDSSGKVSGVANGTAVVTVTSTVDTTKSASCTVTVLKAVNVSLDQTAATTRADGSLTLTPTVTKDDSDTGNLTWSSSDESVATVNAQSGAITILKNGGVTITATSDDDTTKSANCIVTVKKTVNVAFKGDTPANYVTAQTTDLTPYITFSGDSTDTGNMTWSSSNTAIATVDINGVVTAKAKGNAVITAVSQDDNTKFATQTINIAQGVTSITVTSSTGSTTMLVTDSLQLNAEVLPTDAQTKDITWSSSDDTVATVDANGLVTAKEISGKSATVTITASAVDGSGVTGNIQLTVTRPDLTAINFAKKAYRVLAGNSQDLYAELNVAPAMALKPQATAITWSSDNPKITVDANGRVTMANDAENVTGTITAQCVNEKGQTVSCTATVTTEKVSVNLNLATKLEGRQSGGGTGTNVENIEVWLYDSTNHPLWNGTGTTDANGNVSFEIEADALEEGKTVKLWIKGERYLAKLLTQTVTLSGSDWNVTMPNALKAADANTDNKVNLKDFSLFGKSFLAEKGETSYDYRADFNADDKVNLKDFSLFGRNFLDDGDAKPQAPLTLFMTAAARKGSLNTAMEVMNSETAKVAEETLANSTATDEETQEEEILYAVQNATGAELKAENPATSSANSSSDSNSGSSSSSGGCNAGYGALALFMALPLFYRRKK